jgi:putative membrane protein
MTIDAILAIFHHFCVFTVFGTLFAQWTLLRSPTPSRARVRQLAKVDIIYGIAALLTLVVGVLRVMYGVKGSAFYTSNGLFWLKIALFGLMGFVSISPTIWFARWQKAAPVSRVLPKEEEWRDARVRVLVELHLLGGVIVCAVLMARGVGAGFL